MAIELKLPTCEDKEKTRVTRHQTKHVLTEQKRSCAEGLVVGVVGGLMPLHCSTDRGRPIPAHRIRRAQLVRKVLPEDDRA